MDMPDVGTWRNSALKILPRYRAAAESLVKAGDRILCLTGIDGSGTTYRTLVTYKESKDDARTDPLDIAQGIWTGTWRDNRFSPPADGGRPENAVR